MTEAEKFQATLAMVDEATVARLLDDIRALLSPAEIAQVQSYAKGAAGFNLLMAEVGLAAARRISNTDAEELSARMAVARFYQGLIFQEEQRRASELDT
jgi:hypothetical protein